MKAQSAAFAVDTCLALFDLHWNWDVDQKADALLDRRVWVEPNKTVIYTWALYTSQLYCASFNGIAQHQCLLMSGWCRLS